MLNYFRRKNLMKNKDRKVSQANYRNNSSSSVANPYFFMQNNGSNCEDKHQIEGNQDSHRSEATDHSSYSSSSSYSDYSSSSFDGGGGD